MAKITVRTYEESPYNDWNLPANTSKIISNSLNSTLSDDFKLTNTMTTVTEDITYTGELTEVIENTSYDYKQTGSSYVHKDLGEEIVSTTKSAYKDLQQPYMKPGQIVKIIGKDFEPNTEIRLLLDNQLITPVFSNIIYNDRSKPITSNNVDITFNTVDTDSEYYVKRPWVWSFDYDYSLGVWKLFHPIYNNNGIIYYYCDNTHKVEIETEELNKVELSFNKDTWYFKFANKHNSSIIATPSKLTWCEKVLRTPWFNEWLNNQPEDIDIEKLKESNKIDYANGKPLIKSNSDEKIFICTDTKGYFEAEIKIPEKTLSGNHIVTAETAIPVNVSSGRYQITQGSFKGVSYLRHWETTIEKRKIESVHEIIYRDITVTHDINQFVDITKNITYNTFEAKAEADLSSLHDVFRDPDPVAETFKVSKPQYLVGIDIYFSQIPDKSDTSSKPWIAIREVVDGNPLEKMMYYKEIDRDSIISADDPGVVNGYATRPTYIPFDYPIYIEANKTYAFTLGTNNGKKYFIYYSKMGERDITTGNEVTYQKQQSFSGVMKISSNNSVWDNLQDCDIKYTLYKAKFDTNNKKVIYIDNINTNLQNFNSLNVGLGRAVFENTGVDLYYTLNYNNINDRDNIWIPLDFDELKTFTFNEVYGKGMKLGLKIEMWTKDENVTPVVNLDTLNILISKFKPYGTYIQNAFAINE